MSMDKAADCFMALVCGLKTALPAQRGRCRPDRRASCEGLVPPISTAIDEAVCCGDEVVRSSGGRPAAGRGLLRGRSIEARLFQSDLDGGLHALPRRVPERRTRSALETAVWAIEDAHGGLRQLDWTVRSCGAGGMHGWRVARHTGGASAMRQGDHREAYKQRPWSCTRGLDDRGMVDAVGIEPTTSRLRVECSAS